MVLSVVACGDSAAPEEPLGTDDDPNAASGEPTHSASSDGGGSKLPPMSDVAITGGSKQADASVTGKSDASASGAGGSDAGAGDGHDGPATTGSSCLEGISDFEGAGPFKFTTKTAGAVKLWVPTVPAGCKVPVVHLANGTGATCAAYQGVLERLASHGFLTCCYEDTNTGAGSQGVMALQTAIDMYPDLADHKIGSTGHSQGGQAAFTVLQLAEAKWGDSYTYAGLAMEPASGFGTQPAGGSWQSVYAKIKSPMFMFSGTQDVLVSAAWVQQAYDAMPKGNEVYNWSAIGATHVPVPTAPTQEVSIPWFRWKLLGDGKACAAFKALPSQGKWKETKAQNIAACP
ncbi:MAG: chlorophyllase family protein [Myxococcaceae bacterium]|nr:chlorophyllase family protein [Myxococcaceae bacterium]